VVDTVLLIRHVDLSKAEEVKSRLREGGFANVPESAGNSGHIARFSMTGEAYYGMYGSTPGNLMERDFSLYGDECCFQWWKNYLRGYGTKQRLC